MELLSIILPVSLVLGLFVAAVMHDVRGPFHAVARTDRRDDRSRP